MKLALGTVQFGLAYGINNSTGRIPQAEINRILDLASAKGIDCIDTAYAYGVSEIALGSFFRGHNANFKVISKYPPDHSFSLVETVKESLARLRLSSLYGYLLHSYETLKTHPAIINEMQTSKELGLTKKIGFSLYYPAEAVELLEHNIPFDLVQIPYSILDQRFEKVFNSLKERGVEIHARSVFLQGLLFKKPEELTGSFRKIQNKIFYLHECASRVGTSIEALCLGFAVLNEYIDRVVIGVDNIGNLENNFAAYAQLEKMRTLYADLKQLSEQDEQILLPYLWKRK